MSRGASLENAIARACAHYERTGRAVIRKQHVNRVYGGVRASKAPVDFIGSCRELGGSVAIEAKECDGTAFPFNADHITEQQCQALDAHLLQGAAVFLIVEMTVHNETIAVPWSEVQRFIAKPWRHSLSLAWLRAFGSLCPEYDVSDRRKVFFLDASPHPLREVSYAAVVEEKKRAGDSVVELYPAERARTGPTKKQETFRELMARKPGHAASDVEIIRWRDDFSRWELERTLAEAKRKQAQKPVQRRRRRGWST